MTGAGTERCHEAVTKLPGEYDVVINIQGDEPLIDPEIIDDCVRVLQKSPDSVYRHTPAPLLPFSLRSARNPTNPTYPILWAIAMHF